MPQPDSRQATALQRAMGYMARGDGEKVVSACRKLLKKYPRNFDVLHLMGVGYRLQKRFDRALDFYHRALDVNTEGSVTLFCNMAFAYLENRGMNVFLADKFARKARNLAPDLQEVYEVSADVSLRVGDPPSAKRHLKRSLQLNPQNPKLWKKMARVCRQSGQLEEALDSIGEAIRLSPGTPEFFIELGNVKEFQGETESALEAYQTAIDLGCQDVEEVNRKILAMLSTHGERGLLAQRAIKLLKDSPDYLPAHLQLLRTGQYPGGAQSGLDYLRESQKRGTVMMEFAIADGFDKESNYEKSFEHYLRANKQKQADEENYQVDQTANQYSQLRRFFSDHGHLLTPSDQQDKYPTPIFVLGMPRSGTSLTEQMLGTHSSIQPAGELQFLLSLCKFGMREFPRSKRQEIPGYWDWVRDTYLQCLKNISNGKPFVTDKMPHNYELVGFIKRLFPNAVVIHSYRDPISNCLSIFKANFDGHHPYAQDLSMLGAYFAEYQKMMNFWRDQSEVTFLDSRYEDLVLSTRDCVEVMLSLCGLEWEDKITEFHKVDRIVRTASNDQVRQPIYQTSIKSWKKYEAHLAPLFDTLLANGVISQADLE